MGGGGEAGVVFPDCCIHNWVNWAAGTRRAAAATKASSRHAGTWPRVRPRRVSKRGAQSAAPTLGDKTSRKSLDELRPSGEASERAGKHSPAVQAAAAAATATMEATCSSVFRLSAYVNGLKRDARAEKSLRDPPLKLRCSPLGRTFILSCRRGRPPCLYPRSEFTW